MDTIMPNNSQNNRDIIPLKMEVVEDEKIKLSNEVTSVFKPTEDNRTPWKTFGFSARESVSAGKNKYGHNYCRLCLISINRYVREQIFGKETDIGLWNKIEKWFDFTLRENDGYSLYICATCKKLLIQFYKFRVMCQYYDFKLLRTKQRCQNENDQQYSHDYCRLCLASFKTLNQQNDKHSKREKIFDNITNCGLSHKIKSSVNVDVQENDGYSAFICFNCKNQIIKYNAFKLKCQHSNYTLKQAEQPIFTAVDSVHNPNIASNMFKKASVENFVPLSDNKIYKINDHKKIKDSTIITQMATNKAYDEATETNDAKDTSSLLVIDLQPTEAATFQYVETEETVDKKVKLKRETLLSKHYMQEIEAGNGLQLKKVEPLNNVKNLNINDCTSIIDRRIKATFLDTKNSSKFEVTDQAMGTTNKDDTSFLEIDLQVTKDSFVKRVYQKRKTPLSKDVITQENTFPDVKKPILNDITLTGIDSKEIKVKKLDKNSTTDLKETTDPKTEINKDVSPFLAIDLPLRAKETNAKRIYQNRKILVSKHGSLENNTKQPICTTVNVYQDSDISNKIVEKVNMEEVILLNRAESLLLNEEINRVKTKGCRKVRAKIVKTPTDKFHKKRTQANEDSKKAKKRKKLKNQVCHICGLKVHSIAEHIIVHESGKNGAFKCTICGKSYNRKSVCKIHMERHLSVNSYHCLICDMKFPAKDSLKRHLKVHSGVREHQCHICSKRFQNGYNLRTHIRSHTGERPYKCPHCELTFRHRATLNPHVKKCTADAENGN